MTRKESALEKYRSYNVICLYWEIMELTVPDK